MDGDDTPVIEAVLNSDKRRVHLLNEEKRLQELAKTQSDEDVQAKLKQVRSTCIRSKH